MSTGPATSNGWVYGPVTWDDDPDSDLAFNAYFDPHERWNGFLCPYFTRHEADRIVGATQAILRSQDQADAVARVVWDELSSRYILIYADDSDVNDQVPAEWVEAANQRLYPIGCGAWTWVRAVDDPGAYLSVEDVAAGSPRGQGRAII